MNRPVSAGFIVLLTGLSIYTYNERVSDWWVGVYYKLTGEKLGYIATLKFYPLAGAAIIAIGIIVGLIGLFI